MKLYFNLAGVALPAYGTMALIGLCAAFLTALFLGKKYLEILPKDIFACAAYGGIGLMIGAKLFYVIPLLPQFFSGQITTRALWSGYVFYGGLFGIFLGTGFFAKMMHRNVYLYWDLLALVTPLFHSFGRIGCFLAGCCYGKEYHGIFAVQFPHNPYEPEIELVERFPVQCIESIANIGLYIFLLFCLKKRKRAGTITGIYFIVYASLRFILEFFRGDTIRGIYEIGNLTLSFSQIISIFVFFGGFFVMVMRRHPDR